MKSYPQQENNQRTKGQISRPKHQDGNVRFGLILNVILALLLVGAGFLLVRAEQERRSTRDALMTKEQEIEEVRRLTEQQGREVAEGVLSRVRQHIRIPEHPEPTVATITDIEQLRGASDFYDEAKNGDHLIITENRAILYDPDEDVILDVVPVEITPDNSQEESAIEDEEPEL